MLIESLIATVIFSMGVLALVGLQTTLSKNSSDSQYRAKAMLIAEGHLAEMASYGYSAGDYKNAKETTANASAAKQLPNGKLAFTSGSNARFTVTVRWQVPGSLERTLEVSSYMFNAPKPY